MGALVTYQQITRRLLNDVSFARFNDFDLLDWINIARVQTAAEGEAIRRTGTVVTANGTNEYAFSAITISGTPGVPISIRMLSLNSTILSPRTYEWMFEYYIAPGNSGTPVDWSIFQQGLLGSFVLGPKPTTIQTVTADCVLVPNSLATDADTDTLPVPFTHAVPYYAAYMAQMTAQNFEVADRLFMAYERFISRARTLVTPSVLPAQYLGSTGARQAATAATLAPAPTASQGQGQR